MIGSIFSCSLSQFSPPILFYPAAFINILPSRVTISFSRATKSIGFKRCIKLSEAFLNQPSVPINQACEDWSDTKAAYRLFDNEKVTPQEVLRVHQTRTQERMRDYPLVLAVQDTTYLDYTHHPKKKGLGPIGSSKQNEVNAQGDCH